MARTRPRVQIPQAPLRTALKLRWQSTRLKPGRVQVRRLREPRGCSSMAEPHPSKVRTGVRFPVAARSASSTMALHLALNQEVLGSNPRGRTSAAAHGCGPAFVPRAVRVGTGRRPRPGRPTAGVTALRPPDVRVRVPAWTPGRYAQLRLRLCNPEWSGRHRLAAPVGNGVTAACAPLKRCDARPNRASPAQAPVAQWQSAFSVRTRPQDRYLPGARC